MMPPTQGPDFRALFEDAPGLYLVLSPEFKIVAATNAYLRATMTQREAILGKGLFEVFPDNPRDPKASGVRNLAMSLETVLKTKAAHAMAVQKYDIRKPEAEGGAFEVRHWSPLNSPVHDSEGNVAYVIHRVEDVTEFVLLKERSESLDQLESRTALMEAEILKRAGEVQEANIKLSSANQELARLHDEVHERELARHQAELKAGQSLFQAAIEASQDAFDLLEAIRDEQGKITDFRIKQVNARAEVLTGYTREQMVGQKVCDLFPSTRDGGNLEKYIRVVETREPWLSEFGIAADNVKATWVSQQVVHVGDGVAIFTRDLTEKKGLEDQLRRAQKMESVGRLAGGVAHDFNNLLTVIIGYADLALSKLTPSHEKPIHGALKNILAAGGRAAELTSQLLSFARRQVIEPRVLNLNTQIAEAEKMLSRVIGEDIELVCRPDKSLWNCKADPGQMNQVLINLSINARDAMPKGGRLTIETSNLTLDPAYCRSHPEVTPGDYVQIAVSDTGHGMSEETKSHAFEPFFTTKPAGQGTGLGLAICYGIVKQNGGHIWFNSELNIGTTFKVNFPRVLEAQSEVQVTAIPTPAQGDETILLVEDEAMLRDFAALTLRAHGYEVTHASGGVQALAMGDDLASRFDLLVTDVVMPGMSGKELAEQLRRRKPGLKVIFMSGYTADVIVHHGVLDEGVNFLPKPFTPTELARKVREVLDNPRA